MTLRGLDSWITREPDDSGPYCELCRMAGHGAPGRWFDATDQIWVCDDCMDVTNEPVDSDELNAVLTASGAISDV